VLFLGRMNPEKGADLAIAAARAAGTRLILAAKCTEPGEQAWFEAVVRPRLGPGVEWVGQADGPTKKELLARARCLLVPIRWEEPFGLVMVEAMACGTPVSPCGGAPCRRWSPTDSPASSATTLPTCPGRSIVPASCRRWARERFDTAVLAAGYERVYRQVLTQPDRRRLWPTLPAVGQPDGLGVRPA
jgi:hypothetical protein